MRCLSSFTSHTYMRAATLLFMMLCSLISFQAKAEEFSVNGGMGGTFRIPAKTTFLDQRYKDVIRQARDFSCGSAALATMLRYHYGLDVTEAVVLEDMFNNGDQEKIRRQGFSLLDMKQYLHSIGFQANGFKAPLDKLSKVGIPAIVLLNLNNYLHFVVVRGVTEDSVLIADPAAGNKIMPREKFMQSWNQILFVITSDMQQGRERFNVAQDWKYRPSANFDGFMRTTDLILSTMATERLNGYY